MFQFWRHGPREEEEKKRGRLTSLGGTQLGDGCIITENNKRPHTISFFFCLADFLRKFQILRNNIDSFQIKYLILRSSFFFFGGVVGWMASPSHNQSWA
jgi:hypothetical protein